MADVRQVAGILADRLHITIMACSVGTLLFALLTLAPVESACPVSIPNTNASSYKSFGEDCYYFSQDERSDLQAMSECGQGGGFLASIHSSQENNFILRHLQGTYGVHNQLVWLGLYFDYDNGFTSDDRTPVTFTHFDTNPSTGINNCVVIDTATGYWKTYRCSSSSNPANDHPPLRFICKFRGRNTSNVTMEPATGSD